MIALAVLALATADAAPAPAPADNAGGAAQVLADFRTAEAERGPLEGRWRIAAADGTPLYLIELADPGDGAPAAQTAGAGSSGLEGAWLDLRRPEALDGAGYLAAAKRTPDGLVLLFFEGRSGLVRTIRVRLAAPAGLSGEFLDGRRRTPVTMIRDPLLASAP